MAAFPVPANSLQIRVLLDSLSIALNRLRPVIDECSTAYDEAVAELEQVLISLDYALNQISER
jgi:hypothetical protein